MSQNVRFHLTFTEHYDPDFGEERVRNKIQAIKLLRTATGLGLRESKDAVERTAGQTFVTSLVMFGHLDALLAISKTSTRPVYATITDVLLLNSLGGDIIDLT